ncbi:Protein umuD (plasmid) [Fibrisoma limi BUZ 3]|uniref:Protein umuD n=1 Tax=Fibrisoma limi BUZ 3 TaxID=1185876 RepID=I2GTV6_9BACT|nr:S24 family peptidase [Fibrisoma limi]CCH57557.1 Protein umuD [Fibrisoma limi BUZ 3]
MFSSPAENHLERPLDINDYLGLNRVTTHFAVVETDSMIEDDIHRGDILIVDRSKPVVSESIVFVWLAGDHYIKRIRFVGDMIELTTANEKYEPVYVHPGDNFEIFGSVTYVVKKARVIIPFVRRQ